MKTLYLKGALVAATAVALMPASLLSWKLPVDAHGLQDNYTSVSVEAAGGAQITLSKDNDWNGYLEIAGDTDTLKFKLEYPGVFGVRKLGGGTHLLMDSNEREAFVWEADKNAQAESLWIQTDNDRPSAIDVGYIRAGKVNKAHDTGVVPQVRDAISNAFNDLIRSMLGGEKK